jgi:hypothetical protein
MIRLIGGFAVLAGLVTIYNNVVAVVSSPGQFSISMVENVVLSIIAIYGGTLTIQRNPLGKKLLVVFFAYQAIQALAFSAFAAYLALDGTFGIVWAKKTSFLLGLGNYFLCIVSLLFLLRKDLVDNFQAETEPRHTARLAKLLSFAAPGLGRALLGKTWLGVLLFSIYLINVGNLSQFLVSLNTMLTDIPFMFLFINFGASLLIWAVFFFFDWTFVNQAVSLQKTRKKPIKK